MKQPFLRGVKSMVSLFAIVLSATFIGIGALCKDMGMSLTWSVLASGLIWAGPAQVILVSGIGAKTSFFALALTICLSSVRMMPMVVSIMTYLRAEKPRFLALLAASHMVSISTWAEGMRVLPAMEKQDRIPYFLGLGVAIIATSMLATAFGYQIAGLIPKQLSAMLLFLTPVFFLLTLFKNSKIKMDYAALSLGFAGLLVFNEFIPSFALLIAGLGGGTVSYFLFKSKKPLEEEG